MQVSEVARVMLEFVATVVGSMLQGEYEAFNLAIRAADAKGIEASIRCILLWR